MKRCENWSEKPSAGAQRPGTADGRPQRPELRCQCPQGQEIQPAGVSTGAGDPGSHPSIRGAATELLL